MTARISVTMAYYQRPDLIRNTLWAYHHLHPERDDVEFVVIDDKSAEGLKAEPALEELRDLLDIKLFYREDKTGTNPAQPINISVKQASGQIIVITNPETLPLTPVLDQVDAAGVPPGSYLIAPCYSVSEDKQKIIAGLDPTKPSFVEEIRARFQLNDRAATCEGDDAWYIHPRLFPRALYFFAAMPRADFIEMGGIDEDYQMGYAWEDTDFINRLLMRGTQMSFLNDAAVLHQYHYKTPASEGADSLDRKENDGLFHKKMAARQWRVNAGREWGVL